MMTSMHKRSGGFTFVEMLVTLVVVAILAAISYPSYQDYVVRANRADAFSLVNEIMQAQERFYVEELTYTNDLTDLGYASIDDVESQEGHYEVSAGACGADPITDCVLITAVPQGVQAGDGNLTINSRGTRTGNW